MLWNKIKKPEKLDESTLSSYSDGPSGETCFALQSNESYYMSLVSLPTANRHEMDYEFKSRESCRMQKNNR